MITLITGQPGDGKTLYTIAMVMALAEREKRPVYYSGIADLRLPWIDLPEAEKWFDCPPGSIIVIDEAQRIFRPRGNGAAVPLHVSELETHRHKGHDLFIITQQPLLCDANVRRLVGRHFHAKRRFGMQASTVHEWSQVKERPDQVRTDSIRHEFIFPRELYGIYKSAEVHTHKVRIPMRFWFLILLPFLAAGLLYFGISRLLFRNVAPEGAASVVSAGVVTQGSGVARPVARAVEAGSTVEYLQAMQPRVTSLPHTAPRYDQLTEPVRVPFPAACLEMGKRCRCYSDQATPLAVAPEVCRQIVRNGFYVDFAVYRPERTRDAPVAESEAPPAPAEPLSFTIPGYVEAGRDAAPRQERSGETREPGRAPSEPFTAVAGASK